MQELTQEQKVKIIAALNELGAVHSCPRCGHDSFVLWDYILNQPRSALRLDPPNIPSVTVVCDRCGYICHHALAILQDFIAASDSANNRKGE
jgi:predicted RNA-binding Zn-ribbon protein involved in translation (DUF1610 family)